MSGMPDAASHRQGTPRVRPLDPTKSGDARRKKETMTTESDSRIPRDSRPIDIHYLYHLDDPSKKSK